MLIKPPSSCYRAHTKSEAKTETEDKDVVSLALEIEETKVKRQRYIPTKTQLKEKIKMIRNKGVA